jgi:hypothetical protein
MDEEIYFSVDYVFSIISDILQKNGLQSSLDDDIDNIENGKKSAVDTVFLLSKDFAKKNVSEENFVNSLQKGLNIPRKAAENIVKDVKKEILPYAEKITIQTEENPLSFVEKRPSISVEENEKLLQRTKKFTKETANAERVPKKIRKIVEEQPKSSGLDKYREPLG